MKVLFALLVLCYAGTTYLPTPTSAFTAGIGNIGDAPAHKAKKAMYAVMSKKALNAVYAKKAKSALNAKLARKAALASKAEKALMGAKVKEALNAYQAREAKYALRARYAKYAENAKHAGHVVKFIPKPGKGAWDLTGKWILKYFPRHKKENSTTLGGHKKFAAFRADKATNAGKAMGAKQALYAGKALEAGKAKKAKIALVAGKAKFARFAVRARQALRAWNARNATWAHAAEYAKFAQHLIVPEPETTKGPVHNTTTLAPDTSNPITMD